MWADFIPLVSLITTFVARNNGTTDVKPEISSTKVENVTDMLVSPICNFQGNNTNFGELSAVCQSFMLNLDLKNLLDIAETNYRLSALAADVFRQKYANCTVEIDNDRSLSSESNAIKEINQFPVLMDEWTILVFGLNVSLKLLRNFGPAIQKLTIHNQRFWVNEEEHEQTIMGFVNEYCAQSLIKLDLQITNPDTMKKLTGPFTNVEELGCNVIASDIPEITTHNHATLNKFFPNIRNLTLSIKSNTNTGFVGSLPQLKFLSLRGDTITPQTISDTRYTQHLMNRNPQIKALKLVFYPPNFVRVVKLYLPDLESLSLWFFDLGNDRVHFEHVKSFELLSGIGGSPLKISFKQLEELRMWYQPRYAQEWIEFLMMNTHLKRVHVEDYGDNESTLDLESLITQLPNIEDISILSYKSPHFGTVVKFIETHERLQKFKYGSKNFDEHDIQYLKKEFSKKWTISDFNGYYSGLLFERKNSTA
ncbi:uncharacterized protein LOC129570610 isoform X2 [Sitodiplosis mosellana]|nr:uncharacterized protein LOC129570610 isoform X2 [Sitodiplosis mosellana]